MSKQSEAQDTIFDGIKSVAEAVNESSYLVADKVRMLEHIALAYRYASGGAQPGGAAPEK